MATTPAQRSRAAAWALGVLAVLPSLVAAASAIGSGWYPAGDWAMLELATRDVGTGETPLLGPYSRFAWNHPGPLLFYAYAPAYLLSGGASWSLMFSAGLLNGACVAAMVVLAWRRGGLALVAILAPVLAVVSGSLETGFLRDPWNAWITTLPLGLAIMLAWSAIEGDRHVLPWLALVGSLLVQSHVGFGPMVAVLWLLAAFGAWRSGKVPGRWWVAGGAVLVVCWLPVLADQLFGRGNISDLLSHFAGDEQSAGMGQAVRVVARQVGGVAPWMGGDEPADPVGGAIQPLAAGALLLPLVAAAVAAGLALWRRRYDALRFQGVVLAASAVGVISVARISGRIYDYLIRWWWLLAALWWVATLWSLWRSLAPTESPQRWPRPASVLAAGGLVLALIVTTATVAATPDHDTPAGDWYPTMEDIVEPTHEAVAGIDGEVLLRTEGGLSGWVGDALGLALERRGVDVVVDDVHINVHKWREHRLLGDRDPAAVLWVVAGPPVYDFDERAAAGEISVVARSDPMEPDERRLREAQEQQLFDELIAVGREDLVEDFRSGEGIRDAWDLEGVDGETAEHLDRTRRDAEQVVVYLATP